MKSKTAVVCCCVLFVAAAVVLLPRVPQAFAQDARSANVNIDIWDYCDPTSFNNAVGPGTCNRSTVNGAITFDGFVAEVSAEESVGAWRFAPNELAVNQGTVLQLHNLGGETHTFTQVKRFGGGFVDFLNGASGNPTPAPECAQVVNGQLVPQPPGPDNQFIDPGTTVSHPLGKDDVVVNYQCCVHPWMRVVITPRNTNPQPIH
ncbi:MAG TPA: hypothetical protein VJA94_18115 [Candidatus Angelobacter sp.]